MEDVGWCSDGDKRIMDGSDRFYRELPADIEARDDAAEEIEQLEGTRRDAMLICSSSGEHGESPTAFRGCSTEIARYARYPEAKTRSSTLSRALIGASGCSPSSDAPALLHSALSFSPSCPVLLSLLRPSTSSSSRLFPFPSILLPPSLITHPSSSCLSSFPVSFDRACVCAPSPVHSRHPRAPFPASTSKPSIHSSSFLRLSRERCFASQPSTLLLHDSTAAPSAQLHLSTEAPDAFTGADVVSLKLSHQLREARPLHFSSHAEIWVSLVIHPHLVLPARLCSW